MQCLAYATLAASAVGSVNRLVFLALQRGNASIFAVDGLAGAELPVPIQQAFKRAGVHRRTHFSAVTGPH